MQPVGILCAFVYTRASAVSELNVQPTALAEDRGIPVLSGHRGVLSRSGCRVLGRWLGVGILLFLSSSTAFAFDPDDPPETRIPLAPHLTFGSTAGIQYERERNLDLDSAQADRVSSTQVDLSLAFSFDPHPRFQAFLDAEVASEWERVAEERNAHKAILEIKEAFLLWKNLGAGPLFLQVGRQSFEDERQWLLGEELDGVRGVYRWPDISFELSASRLDLLQRHRFEDARAARRYNYLAVVNAALGERDEDGDAKVEIAGHILAQRDASDAGNRPLFFAFHAGGEFFDDTESWLDVAHVRGRDGLRHLRGTGFDVGATREFDRAWSPSLSLGYAFGTGDADPDDGVDRRFRQTGLHDNEGEWSGVQSFKYYGMVLEPELSNLAIVTFGVGIRPTGQSSLDVVYHRYRQHRAADEMAEVGIDADPDGRSRDLGSEVDVIVGFADERHVEWKAQFGYFTPGRAFPDATGHALRASLEVQYQF